MRSILVDIDHVLSDSFPRDCMIGSPEHSWDDYHSASSQDAPFDHMVALIFALAGSGYNIVGITARPEKWRKLTMEWLVKHNVAMHELLMRPDDNFRPAPQIKVELAQLRFGVNLSSEVAFILDDRTDVIEAFQGLGISGMIVHGQRTKNNG